MNILEQVAGFVQHGDRVERAVNPDTGEPFPAPTAGVKILAWFASTSWAKRQFLKWVTAGAALLGAWLVAHGGGEQSAAITAGAVAAFTFFYEQGISWLCNKAKISPPALDDEPEASPPARGLSAASPFSPAGAFPRPSFFTQPTQPMDHDNDPPTTIIRPQPREMRQTPLGPKGCSVIAEVKPGKTDSNAPVEVTEVVRGTLRTEADGGTLIILSTDSGVRTLERSEWDFYVKSE